MVLVYGITRLVRFIFLIAIIRLIIYIITLLVLPRAFWLYPNLFEDCGVLESFQPLYGWDEPKKSKKGKSSKSASKPETESSGAATGVKPAENAPTKRKVVLEEVDE